MPQRAVVYEVVAWDRLLQELLSQRDRVSIVKAMTMVTEYMEHLIELSASARDLESVPPPSPTIRRLRQLHKSLPTYQDECRQLAQIAPATLSN
ncbi:unnamed protein product [Aphanomyces euteiches]|nr:hypothetical protein LEN26_015768 [Aphanomyces euteiches]KAH9102251.1 hypothetical protein AeMF1_021116 [Aphanomyces euteiches]KAH9197228.1 hypothetical protein AeNC1_000766 [Aphanomyces euteiches]